MFESKTNGRERNRESTWETLLQPQRPWLGPPALSHFKGKGLPSECEHLLWLAVLLKVSMGLQASSTGTDQGPHVGPYIGTKPAEHFSFVSTSISSWTKERTDVAPLRLQGASPAGALLRAQHTTQEGNERQRPGLALQARPGCRSPRLHRGPVRSDGNTANPDHSD